ncbi:cytosine permease [Nocardioides sp. YIM 152315]|uniref:cytosine permease n=1 Tax=Nocardioides sp. YIM 152315 TaxID=3031760 RepID=UPI0023DA727E|nr:cytosine permease [Nocardioides sp. YIM 152315]MDF1606160.1 cytosine permease [Nocardioides sp. YIM 152315]
MTTNTGGRVDVGAEPIDPDYPVTPVPPHARKSFGSLAVVLLGFTIFTPTMLAGAQLGPAFGFGELLLVILAGSAILGTYVALMGYVGARTGLTTVVMARYSFGNRGSKLASILLGGTQIGWYGVVVGTIGDLTAEAAGWDSYAAKATIMVLTSVLMCVTACYGYRGMYWVSLVSTPLILVLAVWVVVRSLDEVGGLSGLFDVEPTATMALSVAITTVVGTFVSAGTQAPNWTRFGRSGSQAVWACLIGFLVGNGLMILFGAIGAITFGEGDFVLVLYNLGLVGWGVFLLFGNLWKSNADTAYAFGVAGAELFEKPSKTPFVVGGSVIGTVLALTGVQNHLIDYLGLLGTFIPPLGGVIIADFFLRWRRGIPAELTPPAFDVRNVATYAVASALAYWSKEAEVGIPPVIGIVVAVIVAVALDRTRTERVATP